MKQLPCFSIIIPTYARPTPLKNCLGAICQLDYPHDLFEVIVVDDGGGEAVGRATLSEIVASFREQIDVKLHTQTHAGPAVARNTGAEQARGEYLAFTDDDCAPASGWLKSFATRLAVMPDCMIGGRTVNALTDNLYSTASQSLIDYLYLYYNAAPRQAVFFTTNNLTVPARRFHAMGGFDHNFVLTGGEDRELCDRWRSSGYPMVYAPEALIYHAHELTLRRFWRQHFYYGRGAFHFHRSRSSRNMKPFKIEPISFYLRLLHYPFTQARTWRAFPLACLFGISQMATATGFFSERLRSTPAMRQERHG